MDETSKTKFNLISLIISIIGLILMIVGIYPMFEWLIFNIVRSYPTAWISGFGMGCLFLLFQGLNVYMIFYTIKEKGIISKSTGKEVNARLSIIKTAAFDILLLGIFWWLPYGIVGKIGVILLFLGPIITIIAGLIFQNYE